MVSEHLRREKETGNQSCFPGAFASYGHLTLQLSGVRSEAERVRVKQLVKHLILYM
jgi:hypothetical protein